MTGPLYLFLQPDQTSSRSCPEMIITDVKPYPVWGGNRNFFFVKVETDTGEYGIGEGGLTWRELACAEAVHHLKPVLVGQDARRIEALWRASCPTSTGFRWWTA